MNSLYATLDRILSAWHLPDGFTSAGRTDWAGSGTEAWRATLLCNEAKNGNLHHLPVIARAGRSGEPGLVVQVLDALGFGEFGQAGPPLCPKMLNETLGQWRSTWTDPDTGLTWMRERLPGEHTWEQAISMPRAFNANGGLAGHADWRLPSPGELTTLLIDVDCLGRPFNATVFSQMAKAKGWVAGNALLVCRTP